MTARLGMAREPIWNSLGVLSAVPKLDSLGSQYHDDRCEKCQGKDKKELIRIGGTRPGRVSGMSNESHHDEVDVVSTHYSGILSCRIDASSPGSGA